MRYFNKIIILIILGISINGCISTTNDTVEGGTADVIECTPLEGVLDGADFIPKTAITNHEEDGRTHPDLFYIAWAQLDTRTDLRFPERGYDDTGFEDKLLVSRKERDGTYKTWQIYPPLDSECKDVEKVRIQSFDVAPDGKSLYLAISKPVFDENDTLKVNDLNPNRNLGIFKMDIASKKITPITHDYSVSYSYPTYIGNDKDSDHEMLLISKTVTKDDIPLNYKTVLLDEYDRHPAPLIHKLDTVTGSVTRIGFNNSHQTEPVVINQDSDTPLVVFTEWEHQSTVNRFSLWKMQIDGSDTFMFYGQEARPDKSQANIYQARQVRSGPYKGYILMGEGARTETAGGVFIAEGNIIMVKRDILDLRSPQTVLSKLDSSSGVEYNIARTPEHYNDESFVYAYRPDIDSSYGIYVKDYPTDLNDTTIDNSAGTLVIKNNSYHFMQPRSFYPPVSKQVAPGVSDLSENRLSFTNNNLNGKSGFIVENLGNSDNGVQHELNGINTDDIRMQFFIPSHHFSDSYAIGMERSQELTVPSSNFIAPESDGSMGVVLKEGLYVWKVHKRFPFTDALGTHSNLWVPIRVERQEVSFVKNRVNECNQCHQDRNQGIIDKYDGYYSIAHHKMRGDLSDVIGTDKDISDYNATEDIPDFHKNIAPLFAKPALNGGASCISCHDATDKLNLSNMTGVSLRNATYRNLVLGAHKMPNSEEVLPYLYGGINPMGMDDNYHPAPFLWSLLLNDDLTIPEDENHSNDSSRNLERDGDYGAIFRQDILDEINRINGEYDHSKHWSKEDIQKLITYSSTRLAVGLSDKITFKTNYLSTNTPQAQKAYQALVENCYSCHNNHTTGGINDNNFEDIRPLEKRYNDNVYLRDVNMRFVIHHYLENKGDTKYSPYLYQSDIRDSMQKTLGSALYRVNFNDINNSELLVYARGYYKNSDGTTTPLNSHIKAHSDYGMDEGSDAYKAVENWLNGVTMTNQAPTIKQPTTAITFKEYDEPSYLPTPIEWSDADGELSQAFISGSSSVEHTFSDSMLALEYRDFISAQLKTYAILGDRGDQNFTFTVSDGLDSGKTITVPVTVTSDYVIPEPNTTLPDAYLFFTDRNTSELKKLDTNGTEITIGTIDGFNSNWTTVYRRADKGWLYFIDQENQKIHVISETNATELFNITLNHEPNKETTTHKQTLYLLWWRPAEGNVSDGTYRAGELQGLLESKLSNTKDGDWYVGLGAGEDNQTTIVPEWRTKMVDGGNTLSVYVWKQATFMSKWVNEGIDRLNVLNLVTGKAKALSDFSFPQKTVNGVDYNASDYFNVRAVVVAEDGAFYGFNKDLNTPVETFNFDPIEKIQTKVDVPQWLQDYIDNYQNYATPFLVIEPREKE